MDTVDINIVEAAAVVSARALTPPLNRSITLGIGVADIDVAVPKVPSSLPYR